MTEQEVIKLKESIVDSLPYANSDAPVTFGDEVRATLLLDDGSEVTGVMTEIQLWFNNMGSEYLIVVCVDDGDEVFYCDPDGMELVGDG